MGDNRKRHCWECLRRCLVCDSTRPECKRCSTSGTVCPGYNNAKPTRLRWLPPGRVTSRTRRLEWTPPNKNDKTCNEITTRTTTELDQRTNCVTVPIYELKNEASIVLQCVEYFNACIYQDLVPIKELGEHPYIFPISPTLLQQATLTPDYLQCGMICMILSHRINRTRNDPQSKTLAEKFYFYRGTAIRSLNKCLDVEYKRDIIIAGIITLLLVDVQYGAKLNWQCHLEGVQKLVRLRGGYNTLARSKSLDSLLLCLWFVAVLGNTTCPAHRLAMTSFHLEALDSMLEQYGHATFCFQMCPPPLFIEIIKINHLRMRATKTLRVTDLSQEAYEILDRVHAFSPRQWAGSKPLSKENWMLMGDIYQAAVVLYCISSLQNLSILPVATTLRDCCTENAERLQKLVDDGISSPKTKRFVLWPLVLLGVEAVNGGAAMRAFVAKRLPELSHSVGSYMPLAAKDVLESIWASGETRWDACFDRPYAFAMQIAADTSRVDRFG